MKKKVMILSVILVASFLAMAPASFAVQVKSQLVTSQDKEVKFQEIKAEEVPDAVKDALKKDYDGYTIDKAYKGDDGSYKLNVSLGDVQYVLLYDETGKLLKVEQPQMEQPQQLQNN